MDVRPHPADFGRALKDNFHGGLSEKWPLEVASKIERRAADVQEISHVLTGAPGPAALLAVQYPLP
jgi:hypothetical protein